MERRALNVLGQRILLGDATIAHHAGHGRGFGEPLLLHQQFERPVAAAARRDFVHAGLNAIGVTHRPDGEALQERAAADVLGQLLDRDAGLDAPDVRLGQDELVEGNIARGAEGDLLNGCCHVFLRDGRREPLSRPTDPSRKSPPPSSSLHAAATPDVNRLSPNPRSQ